MDLQKVCDDFFTLGDLDNGKDLVIVGDPAPDIPIDEIRAIMENKQTERDIADGFAISSNWRVVAEDAEYDYDEGTEEYVQACRVADDWSELSDMLMEKMITILKSEGVFISEDDSWKAVSIFMERNGYKDRSGWWVREKNKTNKMPGETRLRALVLFILLAVLQLVSLPSSSGIPAYYYSHTACSTAARPAFSCYRN